MTAFVLNFSAANLRNKVGAMLNRVKDLTPAMREAIDLTHESILEEFVGQYYKSPSGAKKPWAQHVPFGTAKRGRILWNRGRLKAAMTGGRGSVEKAGQRTFAIGIESGATFRSDGDSKITLGEIVSIHRGGLGSTPKVGSVTIVKAKNDISGNAHKGKSVKTLKMYWKLRKSFGLRFSLTKLKIKGFAIPARGFAAQNPDLKKKIAESIKSYILSVKKGRRR